jgi:hypothetical protein
MENSHQHSFGNLEGEGMSGKGNKPDLRLDVRDGELLAPFL